MKGNFEEHSKDFVPETKEVKLRNGTMVKVATPTLGWWFDFLLPKFKELQWTNVDKKTQQAIIKEVQQGKISPGTVASMPLPIKEVLLELLVYYIKKDAEWCKQNLDIADFLAVINAFIQVLDPKRVVDFFGQISQQVPLDELAKMMKGV